MKELSVNCEELKQQIGKLTQAESDTKKAQSQLEQDRHLMAGNNNMLSFPSLSLSFFLFVENEFIRKTTTESKKMSDSKAEESEKKMNEVLSKLKERDIQIQHLKSQLEEVSIIHTITHKQLKNFCILVLYFCNNKIGECRK
jgi:hypothetical protein